MELGSFVGDGGPRIAYRTWSPRSPRAPRATVVVVHTALDHSARYDGFAKELVRRGFTVWAHDQRGHGHSDGDAGVIDDLGHAASDVGRMVDLARREHGTPCFLVGHSLGAVIGLVYAVDHQDQLAGVVTTSVTIDSSAAPLPLRLATDVFKLDRLGGLLAPRFPLIAFDSADISGDADEVEAHRTDPLVHHGRLPMRTATEIARGNRHLDRARLASFGLPLLAVHGGRDSISPPRSSTRLVDAVGSADKTVAIHDDLHHDLFHEQQPARARVLGQIADWIDERA
ncbi:MAG: lysophospholipase [Solirubrobacteraceae bacterium]|nr:alpha/beta hydrolase [Patulibacter sp.]